MSEQEQNLLDTLHSAYYLYASKVKAMEGTVEQQWKWVAIAQKCQQLSREIKESWEVANEHQN